jgi:hypothetical protein
MQQNTASFLKLGGVLLLIYPFVLVADVMSLGAEPTPASHPPAFLLKLIGYSFLYGTMAYPAVYIPCYLLSDKETKRSHDKAALYWSVAPILYLVVLFGVFVAAVKLMGSK